MKSLFITILRNTLFLIIIFNNSHASVWPIEKMQDFTGYSDWDHWDELSAGQRKSVTSYQKMPTINYMLREGWDLSRKDRRKVRHLDKVITKITFPADLVLFRTARLDYRNNRPYQLGEEFKDAGYLSTSINYEVVNEISNSRESTD